MSFPELGTNAATQRWIIERITEAAHDECVEWPFSTDTAGYGRFNFRGTHLSSHRIVCEKTSGPPPSPLHEAAHRCGNRKCGNRTHVRWTLRAENHADKYWHGTMTRGEKVATAKLTRAQVQEIRIRLMKGEKHAVLAAEYGVCRQNIGQIKNGITWTY